MSEQLYRIDSKAFRRITGNEITDPGEPQEEWLVPVEPDEIMVIGEYGIEGEHMDRIFQADYAGEVGTSRLKQGTYAIIKIGGDDES